MVGRCLVFLCILHCGMTMGCFQVAFMDACLGDLPKDNAMAVQRVLHWAHNGVTLGASASLDGEEAWALFLTWEELRPLLAYALVDDGLPFWGGVEGLGAREGLLGGVGRCSEVQGWGV